MLYRRRRSSLVLLGSLAISYLVVLKIFHDLGSTEIVPQTTQSLPDSLPSLANHRLLNSIDLNLVYPPESSDFTTKSPPTPSVSGTDENNCNFDQLSAFDLNTVYIFTTLPANFSDRHIKAIQSWSNAGPVEANINVFADEQQDCDRLKANGLPSIKCKQHDCMHPTLRLPLANCVFKLGKKAVSASQTGRLAIFMNSDILTTSSFFASLGCVDFFMDRFVAVGQRFDVLRLRKANESSSGVDGDDNSAGASGTGKINKDVEKVLHGAYGLDYFAFSRQFLDEVDLKDFVFGAWRWDNYLLSETIKNGKLPTVDMTRVARVYHEQEQRNYQHHSIRVGADHNDKLIQQHSNKDYRFGSTDYTDYEMDGDCEQGECRLQLKHRDNDIIQIARLASAPNGTIALLPTSLDNFEMAMNAMCWLTMLDFKNFAFMPNDDFTYKKLQKLHMPVLERNISDILTVSNDNSDIYHARLATLRLKYVQRVLNAGKNVLLSDTDAIWLENPLVRIDDTCYIQSIGINQTWISSAFMWFRSTDTTRQLLNQVIQCQEQNEAKIAEIVTRTHSLTNQDRSVYSVDQCLNLIGWKWHQAKRDGFKLCVFDQNRFVTGQSFFNDKQFVKTGIQPTVVHTDCTLSEDIRQKQLEKHRLLLWNSTSKTCAPPTSFPASLSDDSSYESTDGFTLGISILTSFRLDSFKRLVESLLSNSFVGYNSKVDLTVFIDYPPDADEKSIEAHKKLCDYAKAIRWDHGNLSIKTHQQNQGVVAMWLNSFNPRSDSDIRLILEDDLVLSPRTMSLLLPAIKKYFSDTAGQYPEVYAISLQNQHSVVGESINQRYGKVHISQTVGRNRTVYAFQQLGTWGSVFFGRPWRDFQRWYTKKSSDPQFSPCVPSFISNSWWLRRKRSVWSIWHIRWAYERGMFSLYFNFDDDKCLASNYREDGENFQDVKTQSCKLLGDSNAEPPELPELQRVPFYDFHFQPVDCLRCVRERWRLLSGLTEAELCQTVK